MPPPRNEGGDALRIAGVHRGRSVAFTFNGQTVSAEEGTSLAAALMASGVRASRVSRTGMTRGYYCGMGACWECVVAVAGRGHVRSCLEPVARGLDVSSISAGDAR